MIIVCGNMQNIPFEQIYKGKTEANSLVLTAKMKIVILYKDKSKYAVLSKNALTFCFLALR